VKRSLFQKQVVSVILVLGLTACHIAPVPSGQNEAVSSPPAAPAVGARMPAASASTTAPPDRGLDDAASLASVKQVGNLPFYTMTIAGDYGFSLRPPPAAQSRRPQIQKVSPWAPPPWGCTVFTAQTPAGERLLGRNFDWYDHPALLLFTDSPGGYASATMVDISYLGFDRPITDWQPAALEPLLRAPYLPFDGLNEAGLAVGMMAVPHAEGGDDPHKTTIDSLEVIRMLLDYAANLNDALNLLEQVNVDFGDGPAIHYLIADRAGNSAVVEFIDGRPQVVRSQTGWQVSTNFLFAEQRPKGASSSCWRYNTASQQLGQAGGILEPAQVMDLLQQVSQTGGSATLWSVVYHQASGLIDVVISREYNQVHTFELH
jgi:hypothetical protein